MTDRQCPSCGGFCKKECERADVMATDEVLRLALEALNYHFDNADDYVEWHWPKVLEAKKALRKALAHQEQEPVAWLDSDGFPWSKEGVECRTTKDTYTPLYITPPKRKWAGLTDEEQQELHDKWQKRMDGWGSFYQAVEQALKDKNT